MTRKRAKTGRPRIEERHLTNEARKPWLKLGMSQRTWYRREAEKRNSNVILRAAAASSKHLSKGKFQ